MSTSETQLWSSSAEILKLSANELYQAAISTVDFNKRYVYLTVAAEQGHEQAIELLEHDYTHSKRLNKRQNHDITFPIYNELIHNPKCIINHGYLHNYLGHMYHFGLGVTIHIEKAIDLYRYAIDKSQNYFAMLNLGFLYGTTYGNYR